jgi:hypothetical protein
MKKQKGGLLSKEIKNYVINRPNETIYIGFSKLPTTYQKRAFIAFLYQAKKEILNLKEHKKRYIKEDMIEEYWEEYLKKNMPIFEVELSFFLKVLNYGKNQKKELIRLLQEMKDIKVTQIKVIEELECRYDFDLVDLTEEEVEKIQEVTISNMITYIKVDFDKKKVYFALSPEINQYLFYSRNYTKMNILVPSFINSTYAIELYEILLDKFSANKAFINKKMKEKSDVIETGWIELDTFYKKMAIDEKHTLREFKYFKRELKKWIKKLNDLELVEFIIEDFETKRSGRKITHLKFYLKEREFPKIEKKETLNDFRQELIKKSQNGFIYLNNDELCEIRDGYIWQDGKILSPEKAFEIWKKLYENKENVTILSKEEVKQKQKEKIKQEILTSFKDKPLTIPIKTEERIELINAYLVGIKEFEDIENFTAILKSEKKLFTTKVGLNVLNSLLKK